jgi:hypothetical protein
MFVYGALLPDYTQRTPQRLEQYLIQSGKEHFIDELDNAMREGLEHGHLGVVDFLVSIGVPLPENSLVMASEGGNVDLIKYLIAHGEKFAAMDVKEEASLHTARRFAAMHSYRDLFDFLMSLEPHATKEELLEIRNNTYGLGKDEMGRYIDTFLFDASASASRPADAPLAGLPANIRRHKEQERRK